MWPPVRSAGSAGPFTPHPTPGSQQFKFQTNSLFLLFLFTGLGESAWLGLELGDSRLTLPALPHQVWGDWRKRCWDYQKVKGRAWRKGSPSEEGGGWGWGSRVEGKNKGSLSAAGSRVPLSRFPNTWACECLSGPTRPSKTSSPSSNPNQVPPLYAPPPELQPPRLGLGSGLPRKIPRAS